MPVPITIERPNYPSRVRLIRPLRMVLALAAGLLLAAPFIACALAGGLRG